ncbi:MAG: hypothetical protein VXW65_01880 [Pseudomonadota bacterium]|nr:hypothetical protein [Pseudomonadota bacterium]
MTPDQWVLFAESGNQQRIQTRDGQAYQGWIMEITDDQLLISTGDGERGIEQWLAFDQIDLQQLHFFDSHTRQWTVFQP